MVASATFGQYFCITFGDHKRVMRRERKECGEERLFGLAEYLSCVIQEILVPDAPITVKIFFAACGFVILLPVEFFDAGRLCIGLETH